MENTKYLQKQKAYKLLSNENRYKLLELLNTEGELSVSELVHASKISQSAVSHQLSKLEDQTIVKATKKSKQVFYQLNNNKLTHYVLALIDTKNTGRVSHTEHQSVMMLFILALWTAVIFFLILAFFL